MQLPDKVPVFIPDYKKNDSQDTSLENLAKEYFNPVKVGSLFSKKTLTDHEAVSFSTEASKDPLLKCVSKHNIKDARIVQKGILKLSGVRETKQFKGNYGDLVMMAHQDQELIDEGYAVLLKQSNGSRSTEFIETMKIFALWGKYFKPSEFLAPYLVSHLHSLSVRTDVTANEISQSQFAYIRICGKVNTHYETVPTKEEAQASVNDIDNQTICFNSTIEEIMWHQRVSHPNLFFPYVVYQMCQTLIAEGGMESEGIFRLPGNASRVDACPPKANKGEVFLKGLDTKDLATLIKQWFRTLEVSIIPEFFEDENPNEKKPEEYYMELANNLPLLQKCTLMFLIGFLRKLSEAEDVTSMSGPNLAMTFAMSIAYIPEDTTTNYNVRSYVQYFLGLLIEKWDVSSIYPVPESML